MVAEKGHYVILKTVRHSTGVRACIDFKGIRNAVSVEHVVQLRRIDAEVVLIPYVD